MKGIALSRLYYKDVLAPMLTNVMGEEIKYAAIGLAGEGSECLGYDDEYSRDHDFGPSACIWLSKDEFLRWQKPILNAMAMLPDTYKGYPLYKDGIYDKKRRGVLEIGEFYTRFLGIPRTPETIDEWRRIPEDHLATATNGEVFYDPLGTFSGIRRLLLDFYPEDVRLHKLAVRFATIAQAGQYNYPRSLKRDEAAAAQLALARFLEAAISAAHLLCNRYTPFYKWMNRSLGTLPVIGAPLSQLVDQLIDQNNPEIVEQICTLLATEAIAQGLSGTSSDFLLEHAKEIHSRIGDKNLQNLGHWIE